MMTSIEIIGFVSAVADFLDLAAENITVAREFGNSGSATTKADIDLERRIKLLDEQINAVHLSGPEFAKDGHEAKLLIRVDKYHDLTVRLLSLLDGFNSAKYVLGKEAKQSLIDELEDWRSRNYLRITKVIRHDLKRLLRDRGNLGYSLRVDLEALEHRITPSDRAGDIYNLGFLGVMRNVFSNFKTCIVEYAQKQILDELRVDGMKNRFEEVEKAHESSFAWILDPDSPLQGNKFFGSEARQQLVTWSLHGHGIFYISGKPGSGKSTLMKYLCQSSKMKRHLLAWAGEKALLMANFFFWQLGTDMQKSHDGMRRALLFSVLEEVPTLIQTVFPKHYQSFMEERPLQVRSSDVDVALKLLLDQTSFLTSHKLAFYIDGLDELDGDHDHLMAILLEWGRNHGESVKLCVSSREWEVFRQKLADCPKIRLQDITTHNITSYVNQELLENEEFLSYSEKSSKILELVKHITEKAEGSFLWVKIVLRRLKWSILSGDQLEDIQEKVDALPNELKDLYQSIFDSMGNESQGKLDRMRAMRSLLTVLHCKREPDDDHPPWLLISHSFLNDYEHDQDFALKLPIQPMHRTVLDERLECTRRLVYQRCMGMLDTFTLNTDDKPRYSPAGLDIKAVKKHSKLDFRPGDPEKGVRLEPAKSRNDSDDGLYGFVDDYYTSDSPDNNDEDVIEVKDDEDNANHLHRNAKYKDERKINNQFPSQKGIRCVHKTVYEFLAQPQIETIMRAESMGFNEADFKLQAFLAIMKIFRPSVHYARRRFLFDFESLVTHYHSMLSQVSEARFLAFLEELSRVLEHHGAVVEHMWSRFMGGGLTRTVHQACRPAYSELVLLAAKIGTSKGLCSLSGMQLARRLQQKSNDPDVVLDTYFEGAFDYFDMDKNHEKMKRRAYKARIYQELAAYFEAGASPNARSNHVVRGWKETYKMTLTCWHMWLRVILGHEDDADLAESFIKLFLLHGADANIWVRVDKEWCSLWWPGSSGWVDICATRRYDEDEDLSAENAPLVYHFVKKYEGGFPTEPLGKFLLELFPQGGPEMKRLADRNLGSQKMTEPSFMMDDIW
ncbi:hypothetical protein GCG54_00013871 [Colletotrichum gloeosporioides]|uniref:NACHT domain-containing protein n=1 Tax=Colletotrichum gloeosporioides TaxID=474922 RepID=A0A8H4CVC3_COLGL|nr:uncharacterized protein GCG54_00013871 [Colletotrichum gloeosporioides]KAF3810629.1 hypothetical protein GCG54_00013871 [Colletotrichum gloeosporioides]